MRPSENIEKLINKFEVQPRADASKRNLEDALAAYKKAITSTQTKPKIWRIIMNNKITKLAAAASILIVVLLGINYHGGTFSFATITFADITEAMKNVPWLYMESRGYERGITGIGKQWIGFESKIHAGQSADGKVTFINLNERKFYKYDPENRTVTIDNYNVNDFPLNLSSPEDFLESIFKMFKKQGAQITTSQTKYNGQKVQLQEYKLIVKINQTNENQSLQLYIQPDLKLIIAAKIKGVDSDGNITMDGEMTFSYPQTGPSDIYDLDVPRTAKIIDQLKD